MWFPTWVVGIQVFGPYTTAFPGSLAEIAGNWVRSRMARTHTELRYGINPLCYNTGPWVSALEEDSMDVGNRNWNLI